MNALKALEIAHTPMTWRKNNREISQILAKKVQDKIKGMELVRIDHKTMVYVPKGGTPKPIVRTEPEHPASLKGTRARAVWYDGKVYRTARDASEVMGMTYSTLYRKLNGKIPNYTSARWASVEDIINK